jgi:hypothetical protein
MGIRYVIGDLIKLHEVLNEWDQNRSYSYYHKVMLVIKSRLSEEQEIQEDSIVSFLNNWLSVAYSSAFAIKAFKFMFEIELSMVPLYINDKDLKVFVMWRLKIGK